MTVVTHTFSTGLIKSAEVNTNFSDLTTALDNITTANLHDSAGIVSSQLADRYALSPWSITVLPFSFVQNMATSGASAMWECHTADVELFRTTTRVQSSKKAYIAFIEVYCLEKNRDGGVIDPQITIKLDDIVIGGGVRVLDEDQLNDDNGFHYIYNSNPIANPLIPIANNQTLKILLSGNAGTPKIRGLTVTFWIKEELAS